MIIEFLVSALLILVVLYVISLVIGQLELPGAIVKIFYLIIGLIILFWVLNFFGLYHMSIR